MFSKKTYASFDVYNVHVSLRYFKWSSPAFQVMLNVQYTGVKASFEVYHLDTVLETDFF